MAEAVKQAADQPLHFAMSAGPIWLSRCLTAVPWYGWVVVPALAYREWRQWPSNRWWDPPLDAAFFILGVVAATWCGRPASVRASLRRRRGRRATFVRLAHRPWRAGLTGRTHLFLNALGNLLSPLSRTFSGLRH